MEGIFTEEEDRNIMHFASKANKPDGTDGWSQVFQKYKNTTETNQSVEDITFRFRYTLLPNIQWTDLLNIEQKLKFCRNLEIQIDSDFRKDLSKYADVTYNSQFVITDFKLKSSTIPLLSISRQKQKFWMFLIENAHRSDSQQFWEDCRCAIDFSGEAETVKNKFYKHYAPKLHLLDIPVEKKLKLYKAFRLPIDKDQLDEIKKTYIIAYYSGVITDYSRIKTTTFTEKEDQDMLQYLLHNFRHVDEASLWTRYHKKRCTDKSIELIRKRWLEKMAPNIHQMDCNIETKLEIYRKYSIEIDKDYLKELKELVDLYFREGEKRLISGWTMRKKIIKMDGDKEQEPSDKKSEAPSESSDHHYHPGKPFTEEEDLIMWKFLISNFKKYKPHNLWSVFKKKTKAPRLVKTYQSRCLNWMLPQLPYADCDVKTKIRIYATYSIPVPKDYLKTLRKYADLQLDPKNFRIIDYAFINDIRALEAIDNGEEDELKNQPFSDQEQQEMWQFFVDNYQKYGLRQLWTAYKQQTQAPRSIASYRIRCQRFMFPKVHLVDVDVGTKLEIYEKYRISVDHEYLEELRQHAHIQLENGRIIDYTLITSQPPEENMEEPEDDRDSEDHDDSDDEPVKKKKCIVIDSDDSDGMEFESQDFPVEEIGEVLQPRVVIRNQDPELIRVSPQRVDDTEVPMKALESLEAPELPDTSEDVMEIDEKTPTMKTYLQELKALISHTKSPALDTMLRRIDVALKKHSDDEAVPVAAIETMVNVGLQLIGD